jgi:hypothetical protein
MSRPNVFRSKPLFIGNDCVHCNQPLVMLDCIQDDGTILDVSSLEGSEVAWFDEWTCVNKECSHHDHCFFDWPKDELDEFNDLMNSSFEEKKK